MTAREQLRRLQLAVDHIARVMDSDPGSEAADDLSFALDHIHMAESSIGDDDE